MVTERTFCDFVLYAKNGPVSIERIYRDEPLIAWFHGARETGTTGFLRTLYLYYIPDSKWLQAIKKLI